MEPGIRAIVETIHASKVRAVLHVTGGGARARVADERPEVLEHFIGRARAVRARERARDAREGDGR